MLRPEDIILASTSPRRRLLLETILGEDFRVNAPGIEELETGIMPDPVLINAERKAAAVADMDQDALVIGADTAVVIDDQWLGKPDDIDDARRMLRLLSGRRHTVVTGVSIIMRCRDIQMLFAETSHVTFKTLSDAEIDEYIRLADPLDMAGAYGAQEHGEMIIEKIEGSVTNVVGFPMERLTEALRLHGVVFIHDDLEAENG